MDFIRLLSQLDFKRPSKKDRSLDPVAVQKFFDYNDKL